LEWGTGLLSPTPKLVPTPLAEDRRGEARRTDSGGGGGCSQPHPHQLGEAVSSLRSPSGALAAEDFLALYIFNFIRTKYYERR